jgi:hypothetical protein
MKKIIFLIVAIICLFCINTKAQSPYKASVGGVLPCCGTNATGLSFKTFFTNQFAFQSDLLFHVTISGYQGKNKIYLAIYQAVELNTNFLYEEKIKDKECAELFWFIGGGASFGYAPFTINGKFGTNTILGLEYLFNKSISLQIDIRPGCSVLFNSGDKLNASWFMPYTNPWFHFDWMIGLTLRKTFK